VDGPRSGKIAEVALGNKRFNGMTVLAAGVLQ
jgi:hypothetical protein